MSVNPAGVNAAAAAAANASNTAVEALISAELNALAADAQALQSQVTAGQVVTAQVLPSNGMTDLIQILGNRVAAALPPGLQPGDAFTAQVTGFNGPQILLQVLSSVDPAQLSGTPPPPGLSTEPVLPEALEEQPNALQLAATRPVLEGLTPSSAPPPAVFVAGSIRPAPAAEPVTLPPPAQVTTQPLLGLADIEARLAAARAGSIGLNGPPPPPPPAATSAPAPAPALPAPAPANNAAPPAPANPANTPPVPMPLGRFTFAPPITPSARFSAPAPAPAPAAAPATEPETPAAPAAPAPANLSAFRDPAALVRALSLPVTPSNLAAAKMALDTPQRLPAALATLESALPDVDDPRVTTLRTMSAFIGRMEPSSPQLAAQISAYVDNVVSGNEPKLVQLLNAQLAAAQPEEETPAAAAPAQPGAPAGAAPPAPPAPPLAVLALAQVVERGAALTVDLKTQLLNVVNAPPAGSEEAGALVPAASSALTAITAVQINAAQAMNAAPQTMAFTLPMWLGSGYAEAHIAIDRDAPEPSNRNLDGDNFHIAFILDTKNLGTVSVDLQTVGRAFSLAVKTESEGTAKRFSDSLTKLTSRLETLRYRVNSAEASVAPRGIQPTIPAAVTAVDEPQADDGSGSGSEFSARA
jgi:hypothetical protein